MRRDRTVSKARAAAARAAARRVNPGEAPRRRRSYGRARSLVDERGVERQGDLQRTIPGGLSAPDSGRGRISRIASPSGLLRERPSSRHVRRASSHRTPETKGVLKKVETDPFCRGRGGNAESGVGGAGSTRARPGTRTRLHEPGCTLPCHRIAFSNGCIKSRLHVILQTSSIPQVWVGNYSVIDFGV
jgi:hypothetical protein